jgi:stage V sporulation protein AD
MAKRIIQFQNRIYVKSGFTIVGPKEGESNYKNCFDVVLKDDKWCEKSFEKCESKMHRDSIFGAVKKAGMRREDIDIMLSGDLLNEIVASNLAARNMESAFLGLFNACSTFGEAILIGSMLLDGGFAQNITCSTSSHFATAERQYRFPLELGNQRKPTAQWTVTGAGCTVLSRDCPQSRNTEVLQDDIFTVDYTDNLDEKELQKYNKSLEKQKRDINMELSNMEAQNFFKTENDYRKEMPCFVCITGGIIGKVVDLGIDDEANMGAAMAPAAFDTITTYLEESGKDLKHFDAIYTGDLGRYGRQMLTTLMKREGLELPAYYDDCGASYYTPKQKTYQGGSGTGCVNTVFNGSILKRLQRGEIKRALIVPTGALLNRDSPLQKETIPGIAHAFVAESFEYGNERGRRDSEY